MGAPCEVRGVAGGVTGQPPRKLALGLWDEYHRQGWSLKQQSSLVVWSPEPPGIYLAPAGITRGYSILAPWLPLKAWGSLLPPPGPGGCGNPRRPLAWRGHSSLCLCLGHLLPGTSVLLLRRTPALVGDLPISGRVSFEPYLSHICKDPLSDHGQEPGLQGSAWRLPSPGWFLRGRRGFPPWGSCSMHVEAARCGQWLPPLLREVGRTVCRERQDPGSEAKRERGRGRGRRRKNRDREASVQEVSGWPGWSRPGAPCQGSVAPSFLPTDLLL